VRHAHDCMCFECPNVPSHYTHPPELSSAGFNSFTEVKRGFEFHDNRPNFYPPPGTTSRSHQTSTSPCSALHPFRHMLVSCLFTMYCLAHQGTGLCPHFHLCFSRKPFSLEHMHVYGADTLPLSILDDYSSFSLVVMMLTLPPIPSSLLRISLLQ
jgi:hypothetical protein